ncbi:hypothetical protein QA633_40170 [Bradyrhizobium barranii]|uniref:hypothetical protein n=1 Tax=Bradyrhizobium barranii TaxID=2992140 RepID=UPI0024AF3435|nr:hypothetical protein [Bradyrhizobium barranii]WFT94408.1 hypothetical protein QA633_40170 [Bradyrhizobium barranii]
MPITADINPGESWLIAGKGLYVFEKEEGHSILLFRREGTSYELRMPEHEFWDRWSKKKIEKIVFDKKGELIEHKEVGPGEVWTITDDAEKASRLNDRASACSGRNGQVQLRPAPGDRSELHSQ